MTTSVPMRRLARALCLAALAPGLVDAATVSFQQGIGGYTGTRDSWIFFSPSDATVADINRGADRAVQMQSGLGFERYGLLQFLDVFGAGPGQVPLGSTILSATLTVTNPSNVASAELPVTVHQALHAWDELTVTSNNFGATAGAQTGEDYDAATLGTLMLGSTEPRSVDLTASVQAVSNGLADFGWLFRLTPPDPPDSIVRQFGSSEIEARFGAPPLLTIEFGPATPVPEPPGLALGAGALALLLAARRRAPRG